MVEHWQPITSFMGGNPASIKADATRRIYD
jgi:hypothetical protein